MSQIAALVILTVSVMKNVVVAGNYYWKMRQNYCLKTVTWLHTIYISIHQYVMYFCIVCSFNMKLLKEQQNAMQ